MQSDSLRVFKMFNDSLHNTQISMFTTNSSDLEESGDMRDGRDFGLEGINLVCSEILELEPDRIITNLQEEIKAEENSQTQIVKSTFLDDCQSHDSYREASIKYYRQAIPNSLSFKSSSGSLQPSLKNVELDDDSHSYPYPSQLSPPLPTFPTKPPQSLSLLFFEYPDIFSQSVLSSLQQQYSSYRRVKQDSASYLRAVGISYIEYLFRPNTPVGILASFISGVTSSDTTDELRDKLVEFLKVIYRCRTMKEDGIVIVNLLIVLEEFDECLIWYLKHILRNSQNILTDLETRCPYLCQALCDELHINIKSFDILGNTEECFSHIPSDVTISILINNDTYYCLYYFSNYSTNFLKCQICSNYQPSAFFRNDSKCECIICNECCQAIESSNVHECPVCLKSSRLQDKVCSICSEVIIDPISAHSCEVLICLDCFSLQIEEQIVNLSSTLICYQCKQEIFPEFYEKFIHKSDLELYHKALHQEPVLKSYPCMGCQHSYSRDEMLTLGCEHYFCTKCMKSYVNYIITNKIFSSKGIPCICCEELIDLPIIRSYCKPDLYKSFCKLRISRLTTTIKCPRCHTEFFRLESDSCCIKCKQRICYRCSGIFHEGVCNIRNVMSLYTFMLYNIGPCPECSTYNYTFFGKDLRVICINPECGRVYLICCSVSYSSILAHGPGRHRQNCKNRTKKLHQQYMPVQCADCKKAGKICC